MTPDNIKDFPSETLIHPVAERICR